MRKQPFVDFQTCVAYITSDYKLGVHQVKLVLTFKLSAGRGFYEYDNHADEVIWDFDPL